MPAEDGIGRENGGNFCERFPPQHLPLDGQPMALVVSEQQSFLSEFLLENLILGAEIPEVPEGGVAYGQ